MYCTLDDIYQAGFTRGAIGQGARWIASVDIAANRIELNSHGLTLDKPIQFIAKGDAILPTPLVSGTVYYAIPVAGSDSAFQVALAPGGAAIDLTSAGEGARGVYVSVNEVLLTLIEFYSRWFDGKAVAHQVPFTEPYPIEAKIAVSVRVAAHASRMFGLEAARITEAETLLLRDIDALVRGVPMRDARATDPANLATFAVWGNASSSDRRTR